MSSSLSSADKARVRVRLFLSVQTSANSNAVPGVGITLFANWEVIRMCGGETGEVTDGGG